MYVPASASVSSHNAVVLSQSSVVSDPLMSGLSIAVGVSLVKLILLVTILELVIFILLGLNATRGG